MDLQGLAEFFDWLLKVGNGQISLPNYGHADIQIPYEFLIQDYTDPIPAIVQTIYPNLANQYLNIDFLQSRSILASNIEVVDKINDYI